MSHDEFPAALRDRFRPVRRIAAGGFGAVFVAEQLTLGRQVAIKVLHASVLADPAAVGRFRAEARITAALRHPNVVQVYDHDVDGGIPWIAYELVEGRVLEARLAGSALPWPEACAIGKQVAEALAAAHALDILHRDIKPANVLETAGGVMKVADFGIAKWTGQTSIQTESGVMLGTPAYISPEQITGGPATAQTDLYALGVMLYEMLTGQVPFVGENLRDLLVMRLKQRPRPPAELVSELPSPVNRLVLQALERDPAGRFASARALADALGKVQGASGASPPPRKRPPASRGSLAATAAVGAAPPFWTRRKKWGGAGLVMAAALLWTASTIQWTAPAGPDRPTPMPSSAPPDCSPSSATLEPAAPAAQVPRMCAVGVLPFPTGLHFFVDLSISDKLSMEIGPRNVKAPLLDRRESATSQPRRALLQVTDALASATVGDLMPATDYYLTLRREENGQILIDRLPFRTGTAETETMRTLFLAQLSTNEPFSDLYGDQVRSCADVRIADVVADRIRRTGDVPITDGHLWNLASRMRRPALTRALWAYDLKHPEPGQTGYRVRAAAFVRMPDAVERGRETIASQESVQATGEWVQTLLHMRPPLIEDAAGVIEQRGCDDNSMRLFTLLAPEAARALIQRWLADTSLDNPRLTATAMTALRLLDTDADARTLGALLRGPEGARVLDYMGDAFGRMTAAAAREELVAALARYPHSIPLLRAAGMARVEAAAPAVVRALAGGPDVAVRRAAALALGWLPGGVRELVDAVTRDQPEVAEAAAWALGRRREGAGRAALSVLFTSSRDRHGIAGWALARAAGAEARNRLVERFENLVNQQGEADRVRLVITGQSLVELGEAAAPDRLRLKTLPGVTPPIGRLLTEQPVPGSFYVTSLGLGPREALGVELPAAASVLVEGKELWDPAATKDADGRPLHARASLHTSDADHTLYPGSSIMAYRDCSLFLKLIGSEPAPDGKTVDRDWGDPADAPFIYRLCLTPSPTARITR